MTRHDERGPWGRRFENELFFAGRGGRRSGRGRGRDRGPGPDPGPEHGRAGGGPGRGFGRGGGFGGGPGGGFGGGPGGGFGGGPGDRLRFEMVRSMSGRGHRRSRGDVRAAILLLLSEQACNGYQIMQEIERRSEGAWRPSSGSVYPALQQLEDERLVAIETTPAGKVYKLTGLGTEYVAKHRDELGVPWQSDTTGRGGTDTRWDVMTLMGQIAPALLQIGRYGTAAQVADARRIISEARRALYRILAEADVDDDVEK